MSERLIIKIEGLEKLQDAMDKLPDALIKKAMRPAVKLGTDKGNQMLMDSVNVRTGATRRALAKKVKSYKNAIWGMAGVDSKFEESYMLDRGNPFKMKAFKRHTVRPAKYWHLWLHGHKDRGGGFARGNDVVKKAFESGQIEAVFMEKIESGIKEALNVFNP